MSICRIFFADVEFCKTDSYYNIINTDKQTRRVVGETGAERAVKIALCRSTAEIRHNS